MIHKIRPLAAVVALLAIVPAAKAQVPDPAAAPQQGVLLLRNGQTIEGKVTRMGEHYQVVLPNGEIRIRAADVEFCCGSLEEGYWRKRAASGTHDVNQRLRLAQWCLNNGLLGHAASELAEAVEVDPGQPMIGVLQRRLQLALDPPAPPPATSKPDDSEPSTEELDNLVRQMPPGTMETFTRVVQPLLTNNCIASGCHGPDGQTKFRLQRISSTLPSRRTTQRNLYAALQWIDRQDPMSSRLLTVPLAPHGPAGAAIFSARQASQLRQVSMWLYQVAGKSPTASPATALASGSTAENAPKGPLAAAGITPGETTAAVFAPGLAAGITPGETTAAVFAPGLAAGITPDETTAATFAPGQAAQNGVSLAAADAALDPNAVNRVRAAVGQTASPDGTSRAGAEGANIFAEAARLQTPTVKRGGKLPQFVPADAFDPEIFNRRFFPQRTSETAR